MQSRMDRYKLNNDTPVRSRTQKNQELYEKIKQSDITGFDVNSNVSVINSNTSNVDINKVRDFLNEKYGDNTPKRKSIDLSDNNDNNEAEPLVDTKEYDINAILEKAKQGKNVDYTKDRLKKVREAQYEILNNLDDEMKKVSSNEEYEREQKQKEADNLKALINTITELDLQNKDNNTRNDLDLLNLSDDNEESDELDTSDDIKEDTKPDIVVGKPKLESDTNSLVKEEIQEIKLDDSKKDDNKVDDSDDTKDDHIAQTLSKLDIDLNNYDDFSDVSKSDSGAIVLKIIIIIIFIALIVGIIYLLNNLLGLDLFNL